MKTAIRAYKLRSFGGEPATFADNLARMTTWLGATAWISGAEVG
jgi:hypothetical protein